MSTRLMSTATMSSMNKTAGVEPLMMVGNAAHSQGMLGNIARYALGGLAISAAGAGVDAGIEAIKKTRQRARMAPLYEEMLRLHPKLKNFDPERVKLYYEQLWHFSPKVAENPLSAGNYVYYSMQYDATAGGPGVAAFGELVKLEESVSKAKARKTDVGQSIMQGATLMQGASKGQLDLDSARLRAKVEAATAPYTVAKIRNEYADNLNKAPENLDRWGVDLRTNLPGVSPVITPWI